MPFHSSLEFPDAEEWRNDLSYSSAVADALIRAYRYLKTAHHTPDGYLLAYAELAPYRHSSMAAQQKMHMDFALALCYLGEDAVSQALDSLDRALEVGDKLDDRPAQVQLNHLTGLTYFMISEFVSACDYFLAGLELLDSLSSDGSPVDAALAIDFLTRLGALNYELGNFDNSTRLLREASSSLTRWAPDAHFIRANITWNEIQHHRLRGNLPLALSTALNTEAVFAEQGTPSLHGRIQVIIMEIALDLAESFSPEHEQRARIPYIDLARRYADSAAKLVKTGGSQTAEGLGRLAFVRLQRVQGSGTDRLHALDVLERKAQRIGDPALIGRIWTAKADEMAVAGNIEWARKWYYKAQRHLEEFELMAMARQPHRARLRLEEMNPGE